MRNRAPLQQSDLTTKNSDGNLCLRAVFSVLFLVITALNLTSCLSEQADDCFTNTGPQVIVTRLAGQVNNIELYDNVNLVIIPGSLPELRVEAGENIVEAIKTEITDSTLVIRNTMKCNWIRNFEKEVTVYLTAPALSKISYEGSGDISTSDTLCTDSLQISVKGGGGSFNLKLKVDRLKLEQHYGTVDFNISGTAQMTTIFSNSYGPFYCNDLISNIVYIISRGSNNCYINVRHILGAEITSVGNIYYSGEPYSISSDISGSGKLIKVE